MYVAFWSFVSSNMTNTASAKKGYPVITTAGQTGSVFGPIVASAAMRMMPTQVSVPVTYVLSGFVLALTAALAGIYNALYGEGEKPAEKQTEKKKESESSSLIKDFKVDADIDIDKSRY